MARGLHLEREVDVTGFVACFTESKRGRTNTDDDERFGLPRNQRTTMLMFYTAYKVQPQER